MSVESPEEYCRQLESYLCRKNDGHLVRIVGPAFEQVCGWAEKGIPLKLACRGIDRYFERYYAKGPRRRPVRIEFCEADVLDVFDEWRRAVGVPVAAAVTDTTAEDEEQPQRRHGSLPSHLDRVVARLTALRGGPDRSLDDVLETVIRELDSARAGAKVLRGESRDQLVERLNALDTDLIRVAHSRLDPATLQQIESEADEELAPFRDRLAGADYLRAREACINRIVRDRARLPRLAFE